MADTTQVVNPQTGEAFHIDSSELPAATGKGYVPADKYQGPPADTTPLQAQAQAPAVPPALPTDQKPNISDADLTKDGKLRVFNPTTGEELHVETSGSLTDINAIRDKGYLLASDYRLDQQTQQKQQAAEEEKQAKLAIEGYGKEDLAKSMQEHGALGLNLPTSVDVALGGLAAPVQNLVDLTAGKLKNAITGRTPEQQQAEIEARNEYLGQHPVPYYLGRIPSEIATALGTGEAAEAVSGAAKVSGVAKAALEGGIFGVQPAAEQLLQGNPGAAAEALGASTLFGVALHGVGSVISQEMERTAQKAQAVDQLKAAGNTIWREMGVTNPATIEKLNKYTNKLVKDEVLQPGKPFDTVEKVVKDNLERLGKLEEGGPKIQAAIKALDEIPNKTSLVSDTLDKMRTGLMDLTKDMLPTEQKQAGRILKDTLAIIDDTAVKKDLSFQDLQKIKNYIGERTNWKATQLTGNQNFANELKKKAYFAIRNIQEVVEDQAGGILGKPEISDALAESRTAWHIRQTLENTLTKMGSKEVLKSPFSMLEHNPLHLGVEGAVFHHLLGLPYMGALALAAVTKPIVGAFTGKGAQLNRAIKMFQADATQTAAKAVAMQESEISKGMKDLFKTVVKAETLKHASVITNNAINQFLPNGGVGLSNKQKVDQLRDNITGLLTNPDQATQHFASITAPLHQQGQAEVANAYTDHQLRLMKVIQAFMPNNNSVLQAAHPFSANVDAKDIAPATMARFNRVLSVAADPTVLLQLVKSNSITQGDVAIAAATNPQTLNKMRLAALDEAMKNKPDLSYQHRLSLGILMGTNLDASTEQIMPLQSIYAPPIGPLPGPGGSSGQKKKPGLKAKSAETISQAALTTSQEAAQGS